MPSLAQRLADARAQLAASGVTPTEAAVDVDLFARTILSWDRARLLTSYAAPAPDALEPQFSEWIERRCVGQEPTAYIVGVREFWGLEFLVSPAVLIPRPETEFIVEEVISLAREMSAPRIADVGTGSGCIAISLARELPRSVVVATDLSGDAVATARENARRHGVDDRVELVTTSYLTGVPGPFDVIAANPPYVRKLDKPALGRGVRHEPEIALFGGDNGLRDIAGVLDTAIEKLAPHGWLVMEFGLGQDDDVCALVAQRPQLRVERIRNDLQDIPRTAIIQRLVD